MSGDARVRIDKWLWAARFFKTRTRAAAEIELGRVRVDGERVKPAHVVAIGARLEIALSDLASRQSCARCPTSVVPHR